MDVGTSGARDEQIDQPDIAFSSPPSSGARDNLNRLRNALETDYLTLLGRLAQALRSHDKATDALHAAYLRLGEGPAVGEVRNPLAYLYRMALNLAANVRQREMRMVSASEEKIGALSDDSPSPERHAIAKHDLLMALAVLDRLPTQRREIFLARWRDDLSQEEIALRFHLHKRTVQKELGRAERFLKTAMGPASL